MELRETRSKKIIKYSLISLGLIIFLLFFSSIPITILALLNINYSKWSDLAQIIYNFICNLFVLGIIIYIYRKTLIKDFKNYFNKNIFNNLENSFRYWLLGFGVMIISNLIISIITKGQIANNEQEVRNLVQIFPVYMAFDVIIYAPFTEELIFRRSIRDITNNKWIYILLSGLIFGGLHVISSLNSWTNIIYIIPYSSLGVAFAYSYYKSNNIFSTITMHAMHNTLSFILLILVGTIR